MSGHGIRRRVSICGYCREILNHFLGALRLTGTRFTTTKILLAFCLKRNAKNLRNEDTLILAFFTHTHPCAFCNCENVRGILIASFAAVLVDYSVRVERKSLIGVNGY